MFQLKLLNSYTKCCAITAFPSNFNEIIIKVKINRRNIESTWTIEKEENDNNKKKQK